MNELRKIKSIVKQIKARIEKGDLFEDLYYSLSREIRNGNGTRVDSCVLYALTNYRKAQNGFQTANQARQRKEIILNSLNYSLRQ